MDEGKQNKLKLVKEREGRWRQRTVPGQPGVVDSDVVGGRAVSFNFCDWWSIFKRNDGGVGAVTQVIWLLLHTHKHKHLLSSPPTHSYISVLNCVLSCLLVCRTSCPFSLGRSAGLTHRTWCQLSLTDAGVTHTENNNGTSVFALSFELLQ